MYNPDFIAIDFETATFSMDSACAVGVALVEDLRVVDTIYSLLKPPGLAFDPSNIAVHGITPSMVEDAPTLEEFWPALSPYFSAHCPVVAHNAGFDMAVLKASLPLDIADFPYIDSIQIAGSLVTGSKSLASCAQQLDIPLQHHNAASDARACAEIAICGVRASDSLFMWEYLAKRPHITIRRFSQQEGQSTFRTAPKRSSGRWPQTSVNPARMAPTVENLDEGHPLYGRDIVFTGELSLPREEAMQMAVDRGAAVKNSITKKTRYLVLGVQDPFLVGPGGVSSKERKAREMMAAGAPLEILDEAAFVALAGGKPVE